jgi:hypothetical protein
MKIFPGLYIDVSAVSAVSAARTGAGILPGPSKTDAAPTSLTGLNKDSGFINKHVKNL